MIPTYYEFQSATKILSGDNAIEHIPYELENLGVSRVLLITDANLYRLGIVRPVLDALADSRIILGGVFEDVPTDSSVDVANQVARIYRDRSCDGIVAVGGGSVLDTAKGAVVVLATGASDLMTVRGSEVLVNPKKPPFVAVPTTAGTGSEATGVAVIKDVARQVKLAFVSFDLAPHVAVIDPRMTRELPARVTASTAMDALAHAIEGASGIQRNPLSDAYAHAAIALIRDNLPKVLAKGGHKSGRVALANAALMAGVAFSNAMVSVVHAIGHACGAVANVAHGDAMAILLPHCMEFNKAAAGEVFAELLLPLAGPDVYAATEPEARPDASIDAVRGLLALGAKAGIPVTLSEAGVSREQFEEIAQLALDDGSIAMNPRGVSHNDVLAILDTAF